MSDWFVIFAFVLLVLSALFSVSFGREKNTISPLTVAIFSLLVPAVLVFGHLFPNGNESSVAMEVFAPSFLKYCMLALCGALGSMVGQLVGVLSLSVFPREEI